MITKTVTIDEKKMYDEVHAALQDSYHLVYPHYDDELPPKLIQQCLTDRSVEPLLVEDVYDDARHYSACHELDELLKGKFSEDEISLFKNTGEYQDLLIEIKSRDDSTPETDLLGNTMTRAYLRFHSNYDCWLPIWEQGGIQARETALTGIMAALSLNPKKVRGAATRRGLEVYGPFPDARSREGKELVDYDDFIRVLCETPNYGNWSFFGYIDGKDLLNRDFDINRMYIPEGTTAAMFNWWNGGGSLDFCKTLRPVTVKELRRRLAPYKDDLKLVVDDISVKDFGYVPCDVYGGTVSKDALLK